MSTHLAATGEPEEIEVLEDEHGAAAGSRGDRARRSVATLLVFVSGAAAGVVGALAWDERSAREPEPVVAVAATFSSASPAPQDGTPAGYLPGRVSAVVELHNTSPVPVQVDLVELLPLPGVTYSAAGSAAVAKLAPNDRTTVPVDVQLDCSSPATRLPDVRLAVTAAGGPARTLVVPVERTAATFGETVSSTCGPAPGEEPQFAVFAEAAPLERTGKRSAIVTLAVQVYGPQPTTARITDIALTRPGVRVSWLRGRTTLQSDTATDVRLRLVVEHCAGALAAGAETQLRIRASDGASTAESGPDGASLELELLRFLVASCR